MAEATELNVPWICCQIGSREYYSIPKTLQRHGVLSQLLTDIWIPPTNLLSRLPLRRTRKLRSRYDSELPVQAVTSFTWQGIWRDVRSQTRNSDSPWDHIIERNHWFQHSSVAKLKPLLRGQYKGIVFAYSYAAKEILRVARDAGWKTVLGQIDAGPEHWRWVDQAYNGRGDDWGTPIRPPDHYWDEWRSETHLADAIIVNSQWSHEALVNVGVSPSKLKIIPLQLDLPPVVSTHTIPTQFDRVRPLKVLFLGRATLEKGIGILIDAAGRLIDAPVEFHVVGDLSSVPPLVKRDLKNIRWTGHVPKTEIREMFLHADLFVFPTFSDGYGTVQLESMHFGVPIIASAHCASVVNQAETGDVLTALTGAALAEAIGQCIAQPQLLVDWRENILASNASRRTDLHRYLTDVSRSLGT